MRLRLSYPFILAISAFVFFDYQGRLLALVCAALIHESGHLVGLFFRKIAFENIDIKLSGAEIQYGKTRITSYVDDILIASLGCLFNLGAIILAFGFQYWSGADYSYFIGVNAVLMVFNLLPALPLDGGRILHSTLSVTLGIEVADYVTTLSGALVLMGGFLFGIWVFKLDSGNFSVLLISLVIFISFLWKKTAVFPCKKS